MIEAGVELTVLAGKNVNDDTLTLLPHKTLLNWILLMNANDRHTLILFINHDNH